MNNEWETSPKHIVNNGKFKGNSGVTHKENISKNFLICKPNFVNYDAFIISLWCFNGRSLFWKKWRNKRATTIFVTSICIIIPLDVNLIISIRNRHSKIVISIYIFLEFEWMNEWMNEWMTLRIVLWWFLLWIIITEKYFSISKSLTRNEFAAHVMVSSHPYPFHLTWRLIMECDDTENKWRFLNL